MKEENKVALKLHETVKFIWQGREGKPHIDVYTAQAKVLSSEHLFGRVVMDDIYSAMDMWETPAPEPPAFVKPMTKTEKRKRLAAVRKEIKMNHVRPDRLQFEAQGDLQGATDSGTGCGLLDNANKETADNWDGHLVRWDDIPAIIPDGFTIYCYIYEVTGFGSNVWHEMETSVEISIGTATQPPSFRMCGDKVKYIVDKW